MPTLGLPRLKGLFSPKRHIVTADATVRLKTSAGARGWLLKQGDQLIDRLAEQGLTGVADAARHTASRDRERLAGIQLAVGARGVVANILAGELMAGLQFVGQRRGALAHLRGRSDQARGRRPSSRSGGVVRGEGSSTLFCMY